MIIAPGEEMANFGPTRFQQPVATANEESRVNRSGGTRLLFDPIPTFGDDIAKTSINLPLPCSTSTTANNPKAFSGSGTSELNIRQEKAASDGTSVQPSPYSDAVNLSDPEVRESLSPSAAHALLNIKEFWKISDQDAGKLLGGWTSSDFSSLEQGSKRTLSEDELRRIASLLEIFAALNSLYSDTDLADKWIQMENKDPFFGGKSPLRYLIQGGLSAFKKVEGYLDAY